MDRYKAEVLADSVALDPQGRLSRLTTMEVTFPRFILAEFNTHRMFSRNSASSRAIPVAKRIQQVWNDPFIPESFGRNRSGMQAGDRIGGLRSAWLKFLWVLAARICCVFAWLMSKSAAHKEHANRPIELWVWHTVVVSATDWENFFQLRTAPDAQPEMQRIAKMMQEAYRQSVPRRLYEGDWHLPYVDASERDGWKGNIARSAVRCAAVSYERQDAQRTDEEVQRRCSDLATKKHWSPFEHQARVGTEAELLEMGFWCVSETTDQCYVANFKAPWIQRRKMWEML